VSREGPFNRTALAWVVGLSGVSLVAALVFVVLGGELVRVESAEADAYSRSALGHEAFVEMLRRLDVPVLVSRHSSVARAGEDAVLAFLEPRPWTLGDSEPSLLAHVWTRMGPTLVVLPKYEAVPLGGHPAWIERVNWIGRERVESVVEALGVTARVVRVEGSIGSEAWRLQEEAVAVAPTLSRPQLLVPGPAAQKVDGRELIAAPEGVFALELRTAFGAPILVVSDPDIFATHGLGDGDNALLAFALVEYLREGEAAVVIDETLHGHEVRPTVWRELVEFPLVLATAHGVLLLVVLAWAAVRRFGAPERPPPAIEPGKGFLIENTAELLRYGGHSGHTLRRYWFNTLQEVGQRLNAPSHLGSVELRRWLDELATERGVEPPVEELGLAVDELGVASERRQGRAVLRLARRIHDWRKDMLDGPRRDSRPS
jgi:hypothetical protein